MTPRRAAIIEQVEAFLIEHGAATTAELVEVVELSPPPRFAEVAHACHANSRSWPKKPGTACIFHDFERGVIEQGQRRPMSWRPLPF